MKALILLFFLIIQFLPCFGYNKEDSIICNLPETVFCSGFEEGNKNIWDDMDGNPDSENQIIEHPGPHQQLGNHVMRFRVPPGRGASDLVKELPGSYDKLYFRWYQLWEPGYDFSAPNHGSGLYGGSRNLLGMSGNRPDGTDFFISTFEPAEGKPNLYTYYRGMYMDCVNPVGQCWGDHFPCWFDEGQYICHKPEHRERIMPPNLIAGKWYCFEMMLDAGTPVVADSLADGKLNYWIDGIEYGPWEKLWFRATPELKLTILWLDLFHHAEHSIEGILLDDIVVSTNRIGCAVESGIDDNLKGNPLKELCLIISGRSEPIRLKIPEVTSYEITVDIYNILGKSVYSKKHYFSNFSFENVVINDLYTGVYLIKIYSPSGTTIQKLLL